MKLNSVVRHGDLIIKKIDILPEGLTKRKGLIVLFGEVTGHAHKLTSGQILEKDNLVFLNLLKDSSIVHEEHATIKLPKGHYAVLRTREWDYSSESPRLVVD